MKRRGFSLIELVVVCSMLGLVIGGAFAIFSMGSRGFQQAVARTGAVGDMHTVTRALERDIRQTHFYSAGVEQRTIEGKSRDGLSVAGLSDWGDPDRFEVGTELPRWDRWVFFYATKEKLGRLVRLETERPPPRPGLSPPGYYPLTEYGNFSPLMVNDPVLLSNALRVTTLCHNVSEFHVEKDPELRLIRTEITLFNPGFKRMTGEQTEKEYLQSQLELSPLNSYPDL